MICLTFTNRAAKSMKERIEDKHPDNGVFIGNIHHFCSYFLFRNKLIPLFTSLIDEEESNQLLNEAKSLENFREDKINNDELLRLNSLQKLQRLSLPTDLLLPPDKNFNDINLALRVCDRYESIKEESVLLDFDDLLILTYYHLKKDNHNLKKYSWIQVDEVQDLNSIQWEIINLISSEGAHKVLFGDYEQAIFSFMGARLERLHKIEKQCKVHNLQKNFRSPSYLLQIYIDYAKAHLSPKWKKDPIPEIVTSPDGDMLILSEVNGTSRDEANYIIDKILTNLIKDDEQTAILVRSNDTAELFSKKLKLRNISHFKISGFDLFRRKVIKDTIAFLSCLYDDFDRVSWFRIFNIFGKTKTLKESRQIVNSMFDVSLYPSDYLENKSNSFYELEEFIDLYKNKRIVLFDTETTGLNVKNDDIIQIAAVEIINGKLGNSFNVYLKTQKDLTDSRKVHNISNELLRKSGVDSKDGLKKFLDFVKNDVLFAHNLKFDLEILLSNLSRNNIDVSSIISKHNYDTLSISRKLFPKLNSYSLEDLISEFNLEGKNSHNAVDDVLATAELVKHLVNEAENRVSHQINFINNNKNLLNTFYKNFYPIWSKWKNQLSKTTSYSEIIWDYLNYSIEKVNYEVDNDDEYHLAKLLRHMEVKCGEKILSDFLKLHIGDYKIFKESDLILGDEKIIISTVHKAKGLEFENVIIPECVKGVYPSWKSTTRDVITEDARTLYVALSRAKKRLVITTHSNFISQYGNIYLREKSPFIKSIEKYFKKISV